MDLKWYSILYNFHNEVNKTSKLLWKECGRACKGCIMESMWCSFTFPYYLTKMHYNTTLYFCIQYNWMNSTKSVSKDNRIECNNINMWTVRMQRWITSEAKLQRGEKLRLSKLRSWLEAPKRNTHLWEN